MPVFALALLHQSQFKHFVAISVALHGTVASFRLGDVKASHLSAEK
jgi:hypothetical protein